MKPRVLWPRYLDLLCGLQPKVAFFFAGSREALVALFFVAPGFVVSVAMPAMIVLGRGLTCAIYSNLIIICSAHRI